MRWPPVPPCDRCGLPHQAGVAGRRARRIERQKGTCPLCLGPLTGTNRWCRACRAVYSRAHRKDRALALDRRMEALERAVLSLGGQLP